MVASLSLTTQMQNGTPKLVLVSYIFILDFLSSFMLSAVCVCVFVVLTAVPNEYILNISKDQ